MEPLKDARPEHPTGRETEVLNLAATGHTNRKFANQLSISEITVRNHISNILDKLHLDNRGQATFCALCEGLAELPSH